MRCENVCVCVSRPHTSLPGSYSVSPWRSHWGQYPSDYWNKYIYHTLIIATPHYYSMLDLIGRTDIQSQSPAIEATIKHFSISVKKKWMGHITHRLWFSVFSTWSWQAYGFPWLKKNNTLTVCFVSGFFFYPPCAAERTGVWVIMVHYRQGRFHCYILSCVVSGDKRTTILISVRRKNTWLEPMKSALSFCHWLRPSGPNKVFPFESTAVGNYTVTLLNISVFFHTLHSFENQACLFYGFS